jgi:hypothetical protein
MSIPKVIEVRAEEFRQILENASGSGTKVPNSVFNTLQASAIEQIYTSRSEFLSSAQSAINLIFVFYSVGGAILTVFVNSSSPPAIGKILFCCILASVFFLLPIFLKNTWMDKLIAGYNLYVASAIHATIVFKAIDSPSTHLWIDNVLKCAEAKGCFLEVDRNRSDGKKDIEFHFCECPHSKLVELETFEQIVAVWTARTPNLFGIYKKIFTDWTFRVGIGVTVVCIILGFFSVCYPAFIFTMPESSPN